MEHTQLTHTVRCDLSIHIYKSAGERAHRFHELQIFRRGFWLFESGTGVRRRAPLDSDGGQLKLSHLLFFVAVLCALLYFVMFLCNL